MAWRLDEGVIRGEFDNRARDVVRGTLWLMGCEQPLEIEVTGNPWRDLAGRRWELVNPAPRVLPIAARIARRQRGVIGDFTASRRIKVYRAEGRAAEAISKGRERWTWTNGIYLEWFNMAGERVLIEAVSYRVTISPEAAWEMSAAEERRQRELNAAALANHRAALLAEEEEREAVDYSAEGEDEREGAGESAVEEEQATLAGDATAARAAPRRQAVTAASTMADVGEALNSAAMLVRALDAEATRPAARQCEHVMKRLGVVMRELARVRLVVEFFRREKLAERAWIDEVEREVRLHARECERLLGELRRRLRKGK